MKYSIIDSSRTVEFRTPDSRFSCSTVEIRSKKTRDESKTILNLIGCARLRYAVIRSKSGRIRQFQGLDTPRFSEVSGNGIFLATEKVRIGKNTVPDTAKA